MAQETAFELNSGRRIHLRELNQSLTYEGLLVGVPGTKLNQSLIAKALKEAIWNNREGAPYLVEPKETPTEEDASPHSLFGSPARLPGVRCVGRFESFSWPKGAILEESWILIVWFQDEFALPIDGEVLEKIKAMDWDKVANDGECF